MQVLKNHIITLRALEPEDLNLLFSTENDSDFWEVSNTQAPFSKFILKKYLANAQQDIYEARQLRLVIMNTATNENLGLIDLFDFNPQHQRAGIGILILKEFQNMGFASESLKMITQYAFNHLNLHQVYANIPTDNKKSLVLFEKLNFVKIGIQKDWMFSEGSFKDVHLYQLIN